MTLPDLPSGVYRHYKGPLYFVFGYGHDANAEDLYTLDAIEEWEGGARLRGDGDPVPLGERAVVVYMGLELTDAHTGPRLATRNVFGKDAFFDRVHMGQPERFTEGTVCEGDCWNRALNQDGLNNHLVVARFDYVGPTWEGST